MSDRTPAAYIPHGGGPLPILGEASHLELAAWLKTFAKTYLPKPPTSIIVISAHWEANVPTILCNPEPPLYYDYYGFPKESYDLKYPAKNNVKLVERISGLLKSNSIEHKLDPERGYDHGVFIPLLLMYPQANIPVVQVGLIGN
jgi:aromatic ring-opening dioxygenase catalytic subunit (LigB family)